MEINGLCVRRFLFRRDIAKANPPARLPSHSLMRIRFRHCGQAQTVSGFTVSRTSLTAHGAVTTVRGQDVVGPVDRNLGEFDVFLRDSHALEILRKVLVPEAFNDGDGVPHRRHRVIGGVAKPLEESLHERR